MIVMYVIYSHVADQPDPFVVRRWSVYEGKDDPVPDSKLWGRALTLNDARGLIPPGLTRIARGAKHDAHVIVETWM